MAEPNLAVEAAAGNTKVNRTKSKARKRNTSSRGGGKRGSPIAFPKHSISKCLRIPQAILEQNAGKECTDREAAKFAGVGWTGQIAVEISSALKFGLLERPAPRTVKPTPQVTPPSTFQKMKRPGEIRAAPAAVGTTARRNAVERPRKIAGPPRWSIQARTNPTCSAVSGFGAGPVPPPPPAPGPPNPPKPCCGKMALNPA